MKKVLALIMALVLLLSLVACGSSKSDIIVSELSKKLESAHPEIQLAQKGDIYSWSGVIILDSDTANVEVKTDGNDQVVSVSITDRGTYNDILSSWNSVAEFMKKDRNKVKVGELTASVCITQSIALIETAANNDSSISTSEKLEELFTSGSCDVMGWKISLKIDKTADVIMLEMI